MQRLPGERERFSITIERGASCIGYADERVLCSLERSPAWRAGPRRPGHVTIPVGCRRGGCGVCRSRVISGTYECCAMSLAHVTDEDRGKGIVLACSIYPRSDLLLRPEPKPETKPETTPNNPAASRQT